MTEKKFEGSVDWLFVSTFETKYWDIIKLWCKVEDLVKFLQENANEKWYVNIDILTSKKWVKYAKLNVWKKDETVDETTDDDDIPF